MQFPLQYLRHAACIVSRYSGSLGRTDTELGFLRPDFGLAQCKTAVLLSWGLGVHHDAKSQIVSDPLPERRADAAPKITSQSILTIFRSIVWLISPYSIPYSSFVVSDVQLIAD
jgi:hypothetical protein